MMIFCGDKVRKGCVDLVIVFVVKEKEGENDFCFLLVIVFVYCVNLVLEKV